MSTEVVPFKPEEGTLTKRGVRRKPRFRRALRVYTRENLMKKFLRVYEGTGDSKQAAGACGISAHRVWSWRKDEPAFKLAFDVIVAEWKEILGNQMTNIHALAMENIERIIRDSDDDRLVGEMSMRVAKSMGSMPDTARVEHTGKDGKPIEFVQKITFVEVKVLEDGTVVEGEILKVEPKALEAPDEVD